MGLLINIIKWITLFVALAALASPYHAVSAANPPDADQKGPVFLSEPTNRIDFSNSTGAEIECKASGNPMPEIIWIRSDGTAVGDVPGLRQVSSDGKLVFPPFRAEDYRQEVHAQVYACLARNQFGSIISRDVHVRAGKWKNVPSKQRHNKLGCTKWEQVVSNNWTAA